MGEIDADSRKLRQCSKYFEVLMSQQWTLDTKTGSSSRLEFYLGLQTDTLYYKDWFSRMNFSFPKQIPSVRHCIELLKVATQIQYKELVDVGMGNFAAVPWTADEEKLIRDFFNSGIFVADIASDLNARLDLPLPKDERQKKYLSLTKTTLKKHSEFALDGYDQSGYPITEAIGEALDNSTLFEDAFYSIISDSESDMCQSLQEYVATLVKGEAEKLWIYIKNHPGRITKSSLMRAFYGFCRLHE